MLRLSERFLRFLIWNYTRVALTKELEYTIIMDANECFQALVRCHEYHTRRNAATQAAGDLEALRMDDMFGPRIAGIFAQEATRNLSQDELAQLCEFLNAPKAGWSQTREQLNQKLTERLEDFYSTEVQVSGQARDRLASPGGPEDADLGLILHIQSEEDVIGNFWDPRSATIRLLEEKGVRDEFTFGYDWHWRAEETFHGRTTCPVTKWSRDLKVLHSDASSDILEILPLPFLITGSSCARENLRKNLSKATKSLEVEIAPRIGILKLDLDFRHGTLRRMILHVHHPCSGFFANAKSKVAMAAQIDAGISFFLWLTGRKHDPDSFGRAYSQRCPHSRKAAPLAEMYSYVKKEREEQRLLCLEEYAPCFRAWAGRYLRVDPASVPLRGESLAGAAVRKIGFKISIARQRSSKKNATAINSNKYLVSYRPNKCSDQNRQQKIRGHTRAPTYPDDKYRQKASETTPAGSWINSNKDASNNQPFRPIFLHHLSIDQTDVPSEMTPVVLWTNTDMDTSGDQDVCGDQGADGDRDIDDNQNASEDQASQPISIDRSSVDEVDIPIPIDDQYEDADGGAPSGSEYEAEGDQTSGLARFHGKTVVVLRCGTVKLIAPSRHMLLSFRLSIRMAQQILGLSKEPTIHFSLEEIDLRVDDHVVYRTPIERLLASVRGAEWLVQIVHELEALQGKPAPEDDSEWKSPGDQLTLLPYNSRLGTGWKNGELRRKLRLGSTFPCTEMKNKSKMGRTCFRNVQVLIPGGADFKTVFIQCDLAPNGSFHPHACATEFREDDPAKRLGIKLKFNFKVSNEEKELWVTLGGECNTKKLNSLVDFLEGKDEDWTERQPRRFLDRNKFRGRMKISYTS